MNKDKHFSKTSLEKNNIRWILDSKSNSLFFLNTEKTLNYILARIFYNTEKILVQEKEM